jgi:DNA repair protein RadC
MRNNPSYAASGITGDPTPSAEDVRITRQLIQAGQILGIKVLDHVVIGRVSPDRVKGRCSLREAGLVEFEG